jgi:organic hydroperoxide reductase OsmC/OhrA
MSRAAGFDHQIARPAAVARWIPAVRRRYPKFHRQDASRVAGRENFVSTPFSKTHTYAVNLEWTGNTGAGTSGYRSYRRDHELTAGDAKPPISGSSDPAFRGDATRWNPEELLLAALSACHQLAYLHLCADAGIVVTAYTDRAEGIMQETTGGGGHFVRVTLHPRVTVAAGSDAAKAHELHHAAHELCFIANSVNFPVEAEPEIVSA